MIPNLSVLSAKCKSLGLVVPQVGKREAKSDYISVLRDYYLHSDYPDGLPFVEVSPMLCFASWGLKPKELELAWSSPSWVAQKKINGCFSYDTPITLSDGSSLPIGEIVEKKLQVSVLSYDEQTQQLVSKRVVGWFDNGTRKSKDWVCVNTRKDFPVVSTADHKFFTVNRGYVPASSLTLSDTLVKVSSGLNDTQMSVLKGTLLGDSVLHREERYENFQAVRFVLMQSEKQQVYFSRKLESLPHDKVVEFISGFGSLIYRTTSPGMLQLSSLYDQLYTIRGDRKTRKVVTESYLRSLSPLSLAVWYMDDGNHSPSCRDATCQVSNKFGRASLATMGFEDECVEEIKKYLDSLGYFCSMRQAKGGKGIYLTSEGSQAFFRDVAPYIIEEMNYKLPSEFWSIPKVRWWEDNKPIPVVSHASIRSVGRINGWSRIVNDEKNANRAFDLEVEDTHNYFAGGNLVHNCRAILYFVPGKGIYATTRNISVKTYRYQEITGKLLFASYKDFPYPLTLDCEAIVEKPIDTRMYTAKGEVTKSSLHSTISVLHLEDSSSLKLQVEQDAPLVFKVLDVPSFKGQDASRVPLLKRLSWISEVLSDLPLHFNSRYFEELPLVSNSSGSKLSYYEAVLKSGGEGVVLKNLNSPYIASSSRRRDAWVKVKKRLEYDAFVSGATRGDPTQGFSNLIGALEFSVYLEDGSTHVLGYAVNMTLEDRKAISLYDPVTDTVTLHPSVFNRVAQISGQDISAREFRLTHCTFDRWRDKEGDRKLPSECVESIDAFKLAGEWVG